MIDIFFDLNISFSLLIFDALIVKFLHIAQISRHFVEVVPNREKTDQAESDSYRRKPDKTVFFSCKVKRDVTDRPLHIHCNIKVPTIWEVIILQEIPLVTSITHLNVLRVVHLEAPTESKVLYRSEPLFDFTIVAW